MFHFDLIQKPYKNPTLTGMTGLIHHFGGTGKNTHYGIENIRQGPILMFALPSQDSDFVLCPLSFFHLNVIGGNPAFLFIIFYFIPISIFTNNRYLCSLR